MSISRERFRKICGHITEGYSKSDIMVRSTMMMMALKEDYQIWLASG